MPVRETVTIRFDGDAADFFTASRAVRAELQALERDINEISERFGQMQRQQAEAGDRLLRRQQQQTEALRNSLESQRIAYLQIGALQQSSLRRNAEHIAQQNELLRISQEQLQADRDRLELLGQYNEGLAQTAERQRQATSQPFEPPRPREQNRQRIEFDATAEAAERVAESQRRAADSTRFYKDVLDQQGDEQVRVTDSTQRYKDILDGLPEDTDELTRSTERLHRALNQVDLDLEPSPEVIQHLARQLELAQQIERTGNRIVHTRERDLELIKRMRSGLDVSSRSLRNMFHSAQQLTGQLLRLYVVTGLIFVLLVSFETLVGILGAVGVAFGAFATIRYIKEIREFRNELGFTTEAAQRLVAANRGVGLSLQETAQGAQAIRDGLRRALADPLSEEATELRLLGLQFTEADLEGDRFIGTLIRLNEQLANLSDSDAAARIAVLARESEEAQRLLERGNLAERFASTEDLRIISPLEEAKIDALQERVAQFFTSFYSLLRGFIADNAVAITGLLQQLEVFLLPLAQQVATYLTDYIRQFEQDLPGIIQTLRDVWPDILATIDQIVLRLEQFASIFTSFGFSGPQAVDVLALLIVINLLAGVLSPLIALIRSVTFLFKGLADIARGIPAIWRRLIDVFQRVRINGIQAVPGLARFAAVLGRFAGPLGVLVFLLAEGGKVIDTFSNFFEHFFSIVRRVSNFFLEFTRHGFTLPAVELQRQAAQARQASVQDSTGQDDRFHQEELRRIEQQKIEAARRREAIQEEAQATSQAALESLEQYEARLEANRRSAASEGEEATRELRNAIEVYTTEAELFDDARRALIESLGIRDFEDFLRVSGQTEEQARALSARALEVAQGISPTVGLDLELIRQREALIQNYGLSLTDLTRLIAQHDQLSEDQLEREQTRLERQLDRLRAQRYQEAFDAFSAGIRTFEDLVRVTGLSDEYFDSLTRRVEAERRRISEGDGIGSFSNELLGELDALESQFGVGIVRIASLREQDLDRREQETNRLREQEQAERDQLREQTLETLDTIRQQRLGIESFQALSQTLRERFDVSRDELIDFMFSTLGRQQSITQEEAARIQAFEDFTGISFDRFFDLLTGEFDRLEEQAMALSRQREPDIRIGRTEEADLELVRRQVEVRERLRLTEEDFARQQERNARIAQLATGALQGFNQTISSLISDALFEEDFSIRDRIRDYFRGLSNQLINAILTELIQPLVRELQLFGESPLARDQQGNFTQQLLRSAAPGLIQAGTSAAFGLGAGKRTAPLLEQHVTIIGNPNPNEARRAVQQGGRELLREGLATAGAVRSLVKPGKKKKISMAHIIEDSLSRKEKRFSYTLGLRSLKRTRAIYHSQEVDEELLDARYGGTLTIPEQSGVYGNPDNARDNNHFGRLDPITWVEDMMAGLNTSEFELHHPTIVTDMTNHFTLQGTPIIENNFLKIQVASVGAPAAAARGLYVKLAGDNPRIYKVRQVNGTTWHLVPGRLPWSTVDRIEAADTIRFRLLNPNDLEEYLDYESRGPYRMDYLEAR